MLSNREGTLKKKQRRAWTPGRFYEVATGALRLLPKIERGLDTERARLGSLEAWAQNVQD